MFLRRYKYIKPEEYSALIGYYDFNKSYYEINFYNKNGDKIIVYVDDYILVYQDNTPYFASVQEKEILLLVDIYLLKRLLLK